MPMFGPRNGEDKVCPDGVRGAREDLKWDCDLGGEGAGGSCLNWDLWDLWDGQDFYAAAS